MLNRKARASLLRRHWRWLLLTAAVTVCAAVALPLTLPKGQETVETSHRHPSTLTLEQRDQLPPEAAIQAAHGNPMSVISTVALHLAIDNMVAGGHHLDDLLENWDAVELCRLSWPEGADAFTGNDAVFQCVRQAMTGVQRQQYGDQFARDAALRAPYAALHEVTITALDPASWHPQLMPITAPCRAGYRAYVRSVHTGLVDRMSVWEFVKDQFNFCVSLKRRDAVEENNAGAGTTPKPTPPATD